MTPTLFESNETDFTTNGLGQLLELYDVDIEEQRNGLLELTGYYPVAGRHYDDIEVDRIILAKPNTRDGEHAFRIVSSELDPINDQVVEIVADSITNDLGSNLITSVVISGQDGQSAMNALKNACEVETIFDFYSDIDTKSSTELSYVNPLEAIAGTTGSILQYWGGEIKRENRRISILKRRGFDDVTTFRIGKNISGLKYTVKTDNLVTRIYPYYKKTETGTDTSDSSTSYIAGKVVDSPNIKKYPNVHIKPVDVSQQITVPQDSTDDQIKTLIDDWAKNWFTKSENTDVDLPDVTIDLDLLSLQNSTDYAATLQKLEQVGLTDSVTVFVPQFGIDVTAVINELHFDPMTETITKITAGTAKQSFADSNSSALADMQNKIIAIATQADAAALSADGKTIDYFGDEEPVGAREGDTWFYTDVNGSGIKQLQNGVWVIVVDSNFGKQIEQKIADATKDIPVLEANIDTAMQLAQDNAAKFADQDASIKAMNDLVTGAKTDAANAADQAISALNSAKSAAADAASALSSAGDAQSDAASALTTAQNAISTANGVSKTVTSISTDVDTLKGTVKTLATSKAVDALSKTVTDAQTLSTQNATELTNKADKTTVDTLNQTVKTQGAQLALTATGADLATTQKQVDQINQTVSDQGAKLALTATTADLSVQQKLVDQLQQTVTDQGAKLALTATGAELSATQQTVSGISDKLDNLSIGGRNYFQGSQLFNGLAAVHSQQHITVTLEDYDSTTKMLHIVSDGSKSVSSGIWWGKPIFATGDQWTFSADMKGTGLLRTIQHENSANSSINMNVQITDEWKRYSRTDTLLDGSKGVWCIFFDTVNGPQLDVYIKLIKAGKGTTATDWVPAIEDDQSLISDLQVIVTKTNASLDVTNQQVALKADKSITDGINKTVSDLSAQQTVQAGQISTMATKTYVDGATADLATKSDVSTATANMATQTYVSGQVQVASDKITNTVEQVKTQLNSQSIGVRNLLPKSEFKITSNGAAFGLTDFAIALKKGDVVTLTMSGHIDQQAQTDSKVMRGYVYAKGWPADANMMITDLKTLDDSTVQNTFVAQKDYTYQFYACMYPQGGSRAGQVTLNWATVVIGNKAPLTWFPAPEDIATVTALTNVSQTVDAVKVMATNTQSDLTALTVKANGWQTTVADQIKGVTNTQTSLANQLTSIISTGDNLMVGGDFEHESLGKSQYWNSNGMIVTNEDKTSGLNTSNQCMRVTGSTTNNIDNTSNILIPVTQQEYEVGMKVRWGAQSQTGAVHLYLFQYDANRQLISPTVVISDSSVGSWKAISGTYTPDADVRYVALDVTYTKATTTGAVYFDDIYIKPNNATASQFAQLQDLISANVTVAGKIAAQLSLSADGGGTALLAGNHVHITGATTIDTAAIESAAIASLSADKLTAGTIDATKINVIGINANNITTGSITGANLSINLNTGRVNFQKGSISSSDNSLDINIDEGYIALTNNYDHSVLIKNGQLQFTQPNVFDPTQGEPYMSISNSIVGNGLHGASLLGRDYVAMSTNENMTTSLFGTDSIMGVQTFAGFGVGKNYKTVIGGAVRGVFISGGQQIKNSDKLQPSPSISIGTDAQGVNSGNRIVLKGEYVHAMAVQYQTTSGSANVFVANDGALVRVTSALKYKDQVERTYDDTIAERLITLPTATWIDKAERNRYNSDPAHQPVPERHFGMIAEDLAAAGIEELVVRGLDGELEGIEYDRIGPALVPLIKKLYDRVKKLEESQNETTA